MARARGRVLLLVAALALTACSEGPVATDGLSTVTQLEPMEMYPAAELIGVLSVEVVGDVACFTIEDDFDGATVGLVLPYEYSATEDGSGIVDENGAVVATVGGRYLLGGGGYALEPVWGECPDVDWDWLTSPGFTLMEG